MKFALVIIVLLIIVVTGAWGIKVNSTKARVSLDIEGKVSYQLELATNPLQQAKGLSGRESLGIDQGMFFVFDRPKIQHFWMKDMQFPIDVLWINNYEIIGISENILPPSSTDGKVERMQSPAIADMVLEINAGQVEQYHIEVGDKIDISIHNDSIDK